MLLLATIYLAAAILAVPIAKRLGLGSVLGYLLAGILIGPHLLHLVGEQTDIMHFAEFGVVMMLFLVGLELQPKRLWTMRRSIVGLGGLQVLITTAVLYVAIDLALGFLWQQSIAIALMLALSSTAIALQTLNEKGLIKQSGGQNAFSVLLFQDIAVIPILAIMPLLAFSDLAVSDGHGNLLHTFPTYLQVIISVFVILAIIAAGHYVAAPLFRYIASTRMRELFTVVALFIVIATALLMQSIGLSPALGTFLAGVVLAESEFRHELEADIEPFKGLLLGLFFMTVGASIDFSLLAEKWLFILASVALLMGLKAAILYLLATAFSLHKRAKWLFTAALCQGGEFAFVLLSVTGSLAILTPDQAALVTLVVAVSMLGSPLIFILYDKVVERQANTTQEQDSVETMEATQNVIVVGYGRFGQVIGRLLHAQGYHLSILDHSPSQIELLRRFGNQVFYGDGARLDLLEAAGAHDAQMLVVAIDEPDKTFEIVRLAQQHFPHLKLVVRATDRRHAYQLIKLGVTAFERETFVSAVKLGEQALKLLGHSDEDVERAGDLFTQHDVESMHILADVWGDDESYGIAIRQRMADLKQVLQADEKAQEDLNTCHGEHCDDKTKEITP
ncbi:monovalent cation:proton antiporter-2 (CPA2) family protein [Pseudoalteromonas peptidolytica]|uniref:Glutathione-regulated potassium-efflux system ancillary protein KefC n=1 Tax=Pseudoalteromonas peptidolytica F12-50-A1 TaxID=1315280 RepID=A0A8I0N0C7_9GAMM|nr:monovalent cation:proton antiporter-2 (CPA2) family protein [Pseudoalteromonas peptidolytica]MBE0348598.1 glutathione-regulated potassium-efflux system ancillary protein KefC [Pseudoalteromonas peptidolytica F12-50-A1]NLR15777.1 potassium transporter [Pseudoalteromonas peptidolytica]GEK11862.1 potassium transporter [Pseudoalteromonas peptidolytica]